MPEQKCANCNRPKSDHSVFDVFCLAMSKWDVKDFEAAEPSLQVQPEIAAD